MSELTKIKWTAAGKAAEYVALNLNFINIVLKYVSLTIQRKVWQCDGTSEWIEAAAFGTPVSRIFSIDIVTRWTYNEESVDELR